MIPMLLSKYTFIISKLSTWTSFYKKILKFKINIAKRIKQTFLSEPVVTCLGVGSGIISVASVSVSSLSASSLALLVLLTLLRPIEATVAEDGCPAAAAAAVVEADECGDD